MDTNELKFLRLLSKQFPTTAKAAAEIINLNAILNLPKGTEVFASDVHGEFAAFTHLLRNGSGSVRMKIDEAFGDRLDAQEKRSLATLIYYPKEKMAIELAKVDDPEKWYTNTLLRPAPVGHDASGTYSRSRARTARTPESP